MRRARCQGHSSGGAGGGEEGLTAWIPSLSVSQIVELLQECLSRLGDTGGAADVEALAGRLQAVTSLEEVTSVEGLLQDLVGLSLAKHKPIV